MLSMQSLYFMDVRWPQKDLTFCCKFLVVLPTFWAFWCETHIFNASCATFFLVPSRMPSPQVKLNKDNLYEMFILCQPCNYLGISFCLRGSSLLGWIFLTLIYVGNFCSISVAEFFDFQRLVWTKPHWKSCWKQRVPIGYGYISVHPSDKWSDLGLPPSNCISDTFSTA